MAHADRTLIPHSQERRVVDKAGIHVEGDVLHSTIVQGDHNYVFVQYLLEGVRRLPTNYATLIQNFLDDYLGSDAMPVPFGGREEALAQLDRWLNDEEAEPYALLAAEAGRGKSALLVHWMTRLIARGDRHVIFIPVSIRYETARASVFFTALAAQLGEVYGEPVQWANYSPEEWRGVCQSFLARTPPGDKPLVVILDGLDEAVGWEASPALFQKQRVPGVRVIVSARFQVGDVDDQGWRQRLGWERAMMARYIPLSPLDRDGIAAVLQSMGNPLDYLATNVDLTSELHRLSEGDPLLVRLYVETLQAQGAAIVQLQPEDLDSLEPGLEGYFDRWWSDQRKLWGDKTPLKEPAVEALLNLLAGALGPLDRRTLLKLLPPEVGVTSRTLADALAPLRRFIVGDGKVQGYIFNHPRLSYYFWEQLDWEGRFLAFGRQTVEALTKEQLGPHKAPAYALQYHGAHLERAGTPAEAFFALVREGWMRAWEAFEGTYAGFLGDVARAWSRAESLGSSQASRCGAITLQVRCALCFASVAALSSNLSASLLVQALLRGLLTPTQALVITRQISQEPWRATMLQALVPHLPPLLLVEALTTARALRQEASRASTLASLAPHLPESQQTAVFQEALASARAIPQEWSGARVLASLAPHLPEPLLVEALATARTIQDEGEFASVLASLAPHLPEPLLAEALTVARATQDEWSSASVLASLAPHLPESLLIEALAAACATQGEWSHALALASLAPRLANWAEQDLDEAYPSWCETLHVLAFNPRWAFLEDLAALLPFALALAGDDADEVAAGIFHAIQEVCAWWP